MHSKTMQLVFAFPVKYQTHCQQRLHFRYRGNYNEWKSQAAEAQSNRYLRQAAARLKPICQILVCLAEHH